MRFLLASTSLALLAFASPFPCRAADPVLIKPSLVTLKLEGTLEKVLDTLQQQVEIAIDRGRADLSRTIKLDLVNLPFWKALEEIARVSDHRLAFSEQGRTIHLLAGDKAYRELPVSFDGVFRTAARRVMAIQDFEHDQSIYDVQLDLRWEPRFAVFLVESPGKSVVVRDQSDRLLTIAGEGRNRVAVHGGGVLLSVRLSDVPRSARAFKSVAGQLTVVGAEKMLRFDFPRLVAGKEETLEQDQVTVRVEPQDDVKEGSDLWTFRVVLQYPEGGPALESFESAAWLTENEAFLLSADNRRRLDVNGGTEFVSQSDRRAVIKYRWVPQGAERDLGKPSGWKLVIKTPSRLMEVPVKFHLNNIPLP